jgi:acetyl esterase/lipase
LLLPALISASEPAPLVLAGDPVRFRRITISSTNGPVFLDIYEPATPPPPIPGGREAIITVVGAGDNRNVPQFINLAQSFAREGIVVVNVGTPTLFQYQVSARDGEAVVQAFKLLEHWPGVDPHHIGIIAFSVGGLLACVGAADPRIRDRVAFIAMLGVYFDVTSLLRTVGRRAQNVDGQAQPWQPILTTLYVLARTVSSLLSPTEKTLLQEAFPLDTTGPPLTARQQAQFSPNSAAFYHLLEGDEPGSVDRDLAALSPRVKALLMQLSLMSVIEQVRAPIHLLHDRTDPSIPFSQAQELAMALARIHHPYDFAAYGIFSHVQVQSNPGMTQVLSDGIKLFQTLYSMVLVGS